MKSLVQKLLLVSLAVAVAIPLAAQDKEKKKKGASGPVAQLKKQLEGLDLTAEQQKKIDELMASHGPKIADATKAAGEGPKKLAEAKKKLSAEGKKGKELNATANEAAKLSADEKAGVEKLTTLTQDLRNAVAAVLTDAQKEKAGLAKGKKKKNS